MATVSSGLASKLVAMVFVGLASKPVAMVYDGLASKPAATVFSSLASKPVATVCQWFGLKTTGTVFSNLALKLVTTVSPGLALKSVVGFLIEPQNQGGGVFLSLALKTNSCGLVIWVSKSPRRFLGLGLKTKQTSVCRLHHKADRGRSARDTRRDLAAFFTWKQVCLGFPSLV
jgi:hypothetical protein